ncbi:hypothetical protein HG537_0A00780 [Torulaspora globosa]|uniref:Zn(2)-C6 fungal-type domain-containing protein n=1 Tax=Torulaspora globosa TaxID=48254 RepID=A0A7H9HKW2_9SACH|nr:hypothetical protein HG537_0A00780 [Torulaspora sp. CBS 2947]
MYDGELGGSIPPETKSYSCSRCRRLKKRCPKQLPSCNNCLKAGETCLYIGRAPRRTKKELEEAKLRGEFVPVKRRRCESTTLDSGNENGPYNHGTSGLIHNLPPESLDRTSSSVSVLGLIAESSQIGASPDLSFNSSTASFRITGSEEAKTFPAGGQSREGFQIADHDVEEAQRLPDLRHSQPRSQLENREFESTPVDAPSIQFEAITGIFKGGRVTPWKTENGQFKPIERSLYDRFLAAYFQHNHKSFYMMDKVAFLNKVSTIRDFNTMDGVVEGHFIFQLYMTMAIGCTTLQRAGMLTGDGEGLSEHFAFLAMKRFRAVIRCQDIETIKCLLLLGIFALFEPKGVSSWTISGIIMRIAIGLGFNRALPNARLKKMSPVDVELRYRVFWSAYCFERLVCTSLGRMSAIDDDEITVPLPKPLHPEEEEDLEVTNMMISVRRMSGRIYKKVHLVSVGRKDYTEEQKEQIIASLAQEIDHIYNRESAKIQKKSALKNCNDPISFHYSDVWLSMRYAQLNIMLYRPSTLIPKPTMESLSKLGDFCLKALKHTYTLYKRKMLPLNWITLFRTLTICNTILYCLCHWSIDFVESKIEMQQCAEILQHFGEKWIFAKKCAVVFQNISATILDICLSSGQVPNMEKLTRELFGASDEYQEILDENNVDVSWIDKRA